MKVPTVNKFLCVFDLKVGGLMLGYLGAIANVTFILLLLKDLLFNIDRFKHNVLALTEGAENMSPGAAIIEKVVHPTPTTEKNASTGLIVFLMIILLGVFGTCLFISVWFIQGVNELNSKKAKPFVILTAVSTFAAFLEGLVTRSFFWTVVGMSGVYFLIVIYSVYEHLENNDDLKECTQSLTSQPSVGYQLSDIPEIDSTPSSVGGYQAGAYLEP